MSVPPVPPQLFPGKCPWCGQWEGCRPVRSRGIPHPTPFLGAIPQLLHHEHRCLDPPPHPLSPSSLPIEPIPLKPWHRASKGGLSSLSSHSSAAHPRAGGPTEGDLGPHYLWPRATWCEVTASLAGLRHRGLPPDRGPEHPGAWKRLHLLPV